MLKKWVGSVSLWILMMSLLSLSYSAYRTDVNQRNQTARSAGFELLKQLNELQLLTDTQYYGESNKDGFIYGWANILMIDDLSIYLNSEIIGKSKILKASWVNNFRAIDTKKANENISSEIEEMRILIKKAILDLR